MLGGSREFSITIISVATGKAGAASTCNTGVKIVCSYTLIVQLKFQNVQLNPTICAVNVSHEKI